MSEVGRRTYGAAALAWLVTGCGLFVPLEAPEPGEDASIEMDASSPDSGVDAAPEDPLYTFEGCEAAPVEPGWVALDVGDVRLASATGTRDGTHCLHGSGRDIWNEADGFRFMWREQRGDVRLTVRVRELVGAHPFAKAGVMVRASLDSGSSHVMMATTPSSGDMLNWRPLEDALSENAILADGGAPVWLRVTRRGASVIGYRSGDGERWERLGEVVLEELGEVAFIGLALSSHDVDASAYAIFEELTVESL